jgi:hypothetical protein
MDDFELTDLEVNVAEEEEEVEVPKDALTILWFNPKAAAQHRHQNGSLSIGGLEIALVKKEELNDWLSLTVSRYGLSNVKFYEDSSRFTAELNRTINVDHSKIAGATLHYLILDAKIIVPRSQVAFFTDVIEPTVK